MVLDLIINCSLRLQESGNSSDHHQEQLEAQELADGMAASIPYYLVDNPQTLTQQTESGSETTLSVGRPIGGLLLMHPMYVVLKLMVVSPELRGHFRERLAWIGAHMGIGQATLLSKVELKSQRGVAWHSVC